MKVAYVFISPRASSYKLAQMILPQMEAGTHGVEVVGMFSFDDTEPGECTVRDTVAGVQVGCFPDLYTALSGTVPDQVISL